MKYPACSRALVPLIGLALALTASTLRGQFAVDWYKVAGGGGVSSNGGFQISGTIGQPDAGPAMSGGGFSITGGFWALSAVQSEGAPLLRILLTPTNTAMVYWPSPSAGFNLQVNTNLSSTNWLAPAQSVTDNGTIKFIIVNPPTGHQFYRLKN
jgi:hypothetical protein